MPAAAATFRKLSVAGLFALALCAQQCSGDVPRGSAPSDSATLHEALRTSISQTHFSALISHEDVRVQSLDDPDPSDDDKPALQLYSAKVIATFKGRQRQRIRYRMAVDAGEAAIVDAEPVIITLCEDQYGLYWPGTGSLFPADATTIQLARELGKQSAESQASFCE